MGTSISVIAVNYGVFATTSRIAKILGTSIVIIAVHFREDTTTRRITQVLGTHVVVITMYFFRFTSDFGITRGIDTITSCMAADRVVKTTFFFITTVYGTKIVIVAINGRM